MRTLSKKQTDFINAYLLDADAKAAAIAAGYSEKSIGVEVCRLLKNKRIITEIERLKAFPPAPPGKIQDTSNMSPMDYLLGIMHDERVEPARRLQAAAKLLPYMCVKPGAKGKKEERLAAGEKAASGKFATPSPPRLAVVE